MAVFHRYSISVDQLNKNVRRYARSTGRKVSEVRDEVAQELGFSGYHEAYQVASDNDRRRQQVKTEPLTVAALRKLPIEGVWNEVEQGGGNLVFHMVVHEAQVPDDIETTVYLVFSCSNQASGKEAGSPVDATAKIVFRREVYTVPDMEPFGSAKEKNITAREGAALLADAEAYEAMFDLEAELYNINDAGVETPDVLTVDDLPEMDAKSFWQDVTGTPGFVDYEGFLFPSTQPDEVQILVVLRFEYNDFDEIIEATMRCDVQRYDADKGDVEIGFTQGSVSIDQAMALLRADRPDAVLIDAANAYPMVRNALAIREDELDG